MNVTRVKSKDLNPNNEEYLPLNRDPFTEFITSRLGIILSILILALGCDIFLAEPVLQQKGMTEELINDIMAKTGVISNFESTLRFINETIPSVTGMQEPENRPGHILASQGARAKYPVVLVPGFITSGLDLWAGEGCTKKHMRQKLWGSLPVFLQTYVTDMKCYTKHLALDPVTGGDPQNIKVRASSGFDATTYCWNVIWVWDKLVANLNDVGYDPTNMVMMPYDWRLSFQMLQERDNYYTQLKMNIEFMRKTNGEKVVLTAHSMGSQVVLYFLKWVVTDEADGGGGGGKDWIEENIKNFINISGPLLGVPKGATALLSGEFKDFGALSFARKIMMEKWFPRRRRKQVFSTWGALWEMLPKGGNEIWGPTFESPSAPTCELSSTVGENDVCLEDSEGASEADMESKAFITFSDDLSKSENTSTGELRSEAEESKVEKSWTMDDAVSFIKNQGGRYNLHGSRSIASWSDPLITPLPVAPSLKIYCFYGIGLPTEHRYVYKKTTYSTNLENEDDGNNNDPYPDSYLPYALDHTVNNPNKNIIVGTQLTDGDVSVPLVSLGYICADTWRKPKLNPSGIKVVTREYKNREGSKPRGPYSSEHVDILGNLDSTTDLLKIVTDFEELEDKIESNIEELSRKISSNAND